jgi:hypothetical protein
MTNPNLAISVNQLVRRFGRTDAVRGLDLRVRAGRCYSWIQWTIKVAVVRGLTLAAVVGLPALVNIGPRSLPRSELVRGALELGPLALAFAAIGLYVSSACSTSLRALVYAFAVAVAANLWVALAAHALYTVFGPFERLLWIPAFVRVWVHLLGPVGFALLLAWLAFQNHRSQERSARRICLHAVVVAFYLAVVIVPQMLNIL